jgi:hypothetical protein
MGDINMSRDYRSVILENNKLKLSKDSEWNINSWGISAYAYIFNYLKLPVDSILFAYDFTILDVKHIYMDDDLKCVQEIFNNIADEEIKQAYIFAYGTMKYDVDDMKWEIEHFRDTIVKLFTKPNLVAVISDMVELKEIDKVFNAEKYKQREDNFNKLMSQHRAEAQRVKQEKEITHRARRGKVVEIPEEWRGKIAFQQTKNKRNDVTRRTRKTKGN